MQRTPPILAGAALASAFFLAVAKAVAAGGIVAEAAPAAKTPIPANLLSTGEIRQVDKAGGKLTIKHGPLRNLDMPGMTMAFRVRDAAMLDQVKAGDRVQFVAESVDGALTVVRIEAKK